MLALSPRVLIQKCLHVASALAAASKNWPQPRGFGLDLGRGLRVLAAASKTWPRRRGSGLDRGLGIGVLASFNITAPTLGAGSQGSKTLVTPLCMLIPFDPEES